MLRRVFLAILLLLAVIALAAGGAAAKKKPKHKPKKHPVAAKPVKIANGVIAFSRSTDDGNAGIYTIGPNGGQKTELSNLFTEVTQLDSHPAFSPDGKTIAFERDDATGDQALWLMGSDGSAPTERLSDAFQPAWSPDGKSIAVVRIDGNGNYVIGLVPVAGGRPTVLCTDGENGLANPVFTPDGKGLVYDDDAYGLVLATLTPPVNCRAKVISPTGTEATFSAKGAVAWIDDGSDASQLMEAPSLNDAPHAISGAPGDAMHPAFAPDGTQIAFTATSDNSDAEIYRIPVGGGTPVDLTNDPAPPPSTCDPEDSTCLPPSTPPDDVDPSWQRRPS